MNGLYCPNWLILSLFIISCYCCVNKSKDLCPPPEKCRCARYNESIVCCNISTNFMLKEGLSCAQAKLNTTKVIHIHNATLNVFNASMEEWTGLNSLTITDGNVTKIQGTFSGALSCIDLSRNNISDIDAKAFSRLLKLRSLDLSRNNIKHIPNITITKHNFTLDISNNSHVWCNNILELMITYKNSSLLHFNNGNDTRCLSVRSFHWFNSTDEMTLSQLELFTKGLVEDCPKHCTCVPHRAEFTPMHPLSVKLNVNCSSQGLTELPPLPPNTVYLDVSNNSIRSLKSVSTNESYAELRQFVADNNKIESIIVLEGSNFIHNFAILSLRNNKIKNIPTYILSNAFDRTFTESRIVKFGGNRLQCDCSTTQVKMWLLNNKNYIVDHDEVLCDKAFSRVIDIDPSKVCIHKKDWRDYIYYIIALEVILLVSLVSKVVYDYWVFKSFGYLPWPASRMPKLPCCDWVLEK